MEVAAKTSTTPGKRPIEHFLRPFQEFVNIEASGGILLLASTIIALAWANSPWYESYNRLWSTKVALAFGTFVLDKDLLYWINDGLMAVFFFVVGLELKREIINGELASRRHAALPIAAALGGMAVPAMLYTILNAGAYGAGGWAIPMATDIAFALGVLTLLGRRIPAALKVFLVALAIVDDIGAVLIIAIFYTEQISWLNLVIGGGFLAMLMILNWAGVRRLLVYAALGMGLWLAFLQSGVHGTVAGVVLAMTIPSVSFDTRQFLARSRVILDDFEQLGDSDSGRSSQLNENQRAVLHALENTYVRARSPIRHMEHALHPWVTYLILPLFALANAGVSLSDKLAAAAVHPVSLGIILGLVLGKQVGITGFSWLAVRPGLASLPSDVTWRQIYGVGWLGGIGFTMSLFIATLAFGETQLLPIAKVGVLTASLIAGTAGCALLLTAGKERKEQPHEMG